MKKYKILGLYLLAGLVSGVIDKWADESSSVFGPFIGSFLGGIGTAAGLWMLVLVTLAVLNQQSARQAIIHSTSYFVALCIGYYVYSQFVLGYSGMGVVIFWLFASLALVPSFTLLVLWAKRTATLAQPPRNYFAMGIIGFIVAIPLVQAISLGFDFSEPTPSDMGANVHAASQIVLAYTILSLLTRTSRSRIIACTVAIALTWPVLQLFDNLWLVLTMLSHTLR